jgi:hypothetical protein
LTTEFASSVTQHFLEGDASTMKIKDGNSQTLIVTPGERVTISIVRSIDLAPSVDYALDDGSFKASKPKNQPCTIPIPGNNDLAMTVFYVGQNGGSYTVRMTGTDGEDVSEVSGTQPQGSAFKIILYRFSLR